MADGKDTTRSDEPAQGSIDARSWLPSPVRQLLNALAGRSPRAAAWLTVLAVVVALSFLAVQQGPALVKGASEMFSPAARLTLRIEPAQPGRLVCTVENPGDRHLLVGGVAVKVLASTPAPFRIAGEMDIPVAQSFSMVLSPQVGSRTSTTARPVTIPPRAVEDIVLSLGSEGERNVPWIQYELEISVESPQKEELATGQTRIAVPVARR